MPKWTEGEDEIITKWYGRISLEKISSIYLPHKSAPAIGQRLKRLNLSKKRVVYSLDENFFSEPNILNSYWAGFIAADGSISNEKNKHSHYLSLWLSRKDKQHLLRFKNDIKYDGPIYDYSYKNKLPSGKEYVSNTSKLIISSKKILADLKNNFNITPVKTFTYTHPNTLSYENILSFIVGYIDGDGTIGTYSNRFRINILGTEKFLQWLVCFFEEKIPEFKFTKISKAGKSKKISVIYLCGIRAKKMFELCSNLNVPKLERKWKLT